MGPTSLFFVFNTQQHQHQPGWSCLLFLSVVFLLSATVRSLSESDVLLDFKNSLTVNGAVDDPLGGWDGRSPPCSWTGVLCDRDSVWGLQLENMGLSGTIDVEALRELPLLRSLSFMNNAFGGKIPAFKKLGALKSLYLSNNKFEGEIPADAFEGMAWLKKLHLSQNKFTGKIPESLTKMPKLLELTLDGNQFSGELPAFDKHPPQRLNLSDNAFTGPIPPSLSSKDPNIFAGNKGLCGKPLATACDSPPPPATPPAATVAAEPQPSNPSGADKKSLKGPILMASIGIAVLILIILAVVCIINRRKQQPPQLPIEAVPSSLQKKSGILGDHSPARSGVGSSGRRSGDVTNGKKGDANTKLSFLKEDVERFELQDLLKASAEILGSGSFGASYKAAIQTGPVMVVKRFKQMNNVGKEDFEEHMRRLGRLRHRNLLPLVAYYYRKEEKLLVGDFVDNGSLALHLHGQTGLDWLTRLRVVKGVASGLDYLYKELPSLIAPHGHLKSSNILLNNNLEPLLNDYGLIPVINREAAQDLMVAYRSPEYFQHSRITKKTDVWALGILILEVLTGRFPPNFSKKNGGKGDEDDLASWVRSMFDGEWNSEVFDREMVIVENKFYEGEMLKLMNVGLGCVETDVEKRFDVKEAVVRIMEVKEKEEDDDFQDSTGTSVEITNVS